MDIESNKKVVERYFDAVNHGDEQGILACITDDFIFQSMPRNPAWLRYRWNREQFAASPKLMSSYMHRPIQMKLLGMTAEDDRVCVEAESHGELKNGKVYENAYHFLFRFKDGKIAAVKEYSCSFTANAVFAEFQQNFDAL